MSNDMGGFGKFYERAFRGSMMGAGPHVFSLMAYCVSHAKPPFGELEINPELVSFFVGCEKEEMQKALDFLQAPDPRSRTEGESGKRLVFVGGFTYRLVNFSVYRDGLDIEAKRAKDAEYQRARRAKQNGNVPQGTPAAKPERPELFMPTSVQLRLGALFRRKATTAWSPGEMKAFKAIGDIAEEDLAKLEAYYRAKLPENTMDIRRRDLVTMLNNFSGEMDRARSFKGNTYL